MPQGTVEGFLRDTTRHSSWKDMFEVAVLGGVAGAALGYFKDKSGDTAKSYGLWGVGIGLASQYLLLHTLPRSRTAGGYYTGAVNRGGYGGNGGMPFGPGPWPTKNAAAPDSNMQTPDPVRAGLVEGFAEEGEVLAGWGHGEMRPPYGRGFGPPWNPSYYPWAE